MQELAYFSSFFLERKRTKKLSKQKQSNSLADQSKTASCTVKEKEEEEEEEEYDELLLFTMVELDVDEHEGLPFLTIRSGGGLPATATLRFM